MVVVGVGAVGGRMIRMGTLVEVVVVVVAAAVVEDLSGLQAVIFESMIFGGDFFFLGEGCEAKQPSRPSRDT